MAIEFHCTRCNKLLRTPEGTAGKQAKCPECGTVLTVPEAGSAPPGQAPPSQPPPPGTEPGSPFAPGQPKPAAFDPENPYAAPSQYGPPAPDYVPPEGEFTPAIIDFNDIFSRTWTIFKQQWGMCAVAVLIVMAIDAVIQVPVMVLSIAMQASGADEVVAFLVTQSANILASVLQLFFTIGLSLFFLKVARGEQAELGDIFAGGPYYLRILGASILVGMMVLAGMALCIVPGVILGLMFSQFYYLILDRRVGIIDSLKISHQITTGNKLTLFLIGLAKMGLTLLGLLACCVGLLAVVPFLTLVTPVTYLVMTGQPTADQMLPGRPPVR